MGEKVAQLVLEASCKTSFIPHAQSHAAAEEQCALSPAEKLLYPVPCKCLVKHSPHLEVWNSHLHFKSPTERYLSHLSCKKNGPGTGDIHVTRNTVF